MPVVKRDGCEIWQIDFQYLGKRYMMTSGETSEAAARKKEKEERAKVIARLASTPLAMPHLVLANGAFPTVLQGPRLSADQVAKEYWKLKGQYTENALELFNKLPRALELIEPDLDIAMLDDRAMLAARGKFMATPPTKWTKKPGERSPADVNDMLRLIFRLYNFARDILHIRMQFDLHPKVWLLPDPVHTRELSFVEEIQLEHVCRKIDPELIPVWKFMIKTGVRETAGCTLAWKNTNLVDRKITVALKGRGKKKALHRVHLVDEAIEILNALRDHHPKFVFTIVLKKASLYQGRIRKAGERVPLTPKTFAQRMRVVLRAAGIEDFTVADLRHTAATRMLRACGTLAIVQKFLGHTTEKCTKRYAAMVDDDLAAAQEMTAAVDARGLRRVRAMLRDVTSATSNDVEQALALQAKCEQKIKKELWSRFKQAGYDFATAA